MEMVFFISSLVRCLTVTFSSEGQTPKTHFEGEGAKFNRKVIRKQRAEKGERNPHSVGSFLPRHVNIISSIIAGKTKVYLQYYPLLGVNSRK
jgi:hypothetical protein